MEAPSGGPAPYTTRLGLPEDDVTFAPPPMSAYSIAVFNNNGAYSPPQERTKKESFIARDQRLPAENAALRDQLKRKLSVHFLRLPPGTEKSPVLRLPASRYSSTVSSHGKTLSHSFSGNSASTLATFNASDVNMSSVLHIDSGSGSATLNDQKGHSFAGFANYGDESSMATRSKSFGSEPALQNQLSRDHSPRTTSMSGESMGLGGLSTTTLGTEVSSSKRSRGANSEASFLPTHKEPIVSPHPGRTLPSGDHKPEFASISCVPSYLSSRPFTSGMAARRSRVNRRFRALGPPKRASEMISAFSAANTSREKVNSPSETAGNPLLNESGLSPHPLVSSFSPEKEISFGKSAVSADSDFFKSLKRLKEASPRPEDPEPKKFRSPNSVSSQPSPYSQSKTPILPENFHASHPKQHIPLAGKNSAPRKPLRDVSPAVINSAHGNDEFKKPKPPKSAVLEKPIISRDPTPQVPARRPITKAPNELTREHHTHYNEDRGKKIIRMKSKEYEKLEILGRGGSSKVYKVRSLVDKKAYALKKVSFDQFDESCVRGFKGEIDLLMRLKDEVRVVSLVDHDASEGSLYLLMECGDVDLAHVLQNKFLADSTLDPNFVRFHASEVFKCIQAVHCAGIVHSDLKPANFLFVGGILKIIDFGIANAVPDHTVNIYRHSQIGTPNYMAPEALVEVNNTLSFSKSSSTTWRVGRPSDIWSCGCIIYQMIYGRPPYASFSGQQRIMAIMNPQVKVKYAATGLGGVPVPLSAIELMRKCLERNPSDRWTVEECLNCDFLRPKAVNAGFVKDVLRNAVSLAAKSPRTGNIDERTYDELVQSLLGQIKDLNFA